jgi:hypothetical protein
MPMIQIDSYHPGGALHRRILEAATVAAAIEEFTRTAVPRMNPQIVRVNALIVWTSLHADHDAVTQAPEGIPLPIWQAREVVSFFADQTGEAHWGRGAVFLRKGGSSQPRIGVTTGRLLMHLNEVGAVHQAALTLWRPNTLSAHQRLALPAQLEALHQRDAAIRADA